MNLVLFDLDYTLLPIDSDHSWGEFTTRIGWTDPVEFRRRNDEFFSQYQAGVLDVHEYIRFATGPIRSRGAQAAARAHEAFMREVIFPAIKPQALELVQSHRNAGDELVIVTATNEFITRPIADAFGVDHLIAVELERDPSGWFTGEIQGIASFRGGKVDRVGQWLAQRGLGWSDVSSIFYSDSTNDLPLLEKVDTAVATNPAPALREIAQARGWRVLDLFGN